MAPTTTEEYLNTEADFNRSVTRAAPRNYDIAHFSVFRQICLHLAAGYGLYIVFTEAQWKTVIFCGLCAVLSLSYNTNGMIWGSGYFYTATIALIYAHVTLGTFLTAGIGMFYTYAGGLGITIGANRLWTHKAFKAKLPLEIILMILNSIAFQDTAIVWIRDHRLHHKYSDTDADPYNASKGFFFSHVGWLLVRKHPKVIEKGKTIDMSDITNNAVLKFQQKYAIPVIGMCCFVIPTLVPIYFWNESFINAFYLNLFRYVYELHVTFSVNSVTHLWGNKPYDKTIKPTQSIIVSLLSGGEGYHNYHHVFPWDYRTAEIGNNWINTSTLIIDLMAKIGLAYDLKTTTETMVLERLKRTGDGSNLWGIGRKL